MAGRRATTPNQVTSARIRARASAIVAALRKSRPNARVELSHNSPFELLIATILSAQCTDARVNQVLPGLLHAYPTPAAMAKADPARLEALIRSTGFFRSKAKSILGCSREILVTHGGAVPRTMEALSALPGVGRKTANVVLGAAYGVAAGIVVDTHMARVARRLGLTQQQEPERIETDLMALVSPEDWIFFSIAMVLHGRYVCLARLPRCGECPLSRLCPSADQAVPARVRRPRGRGRG
jgi:endonuclease-3